MMFQRRICSSVDLRRLGEEAEAENDPDDRCPLLEPVLEIHLS